MNKNVFAGDYASVDAEIERLKPLSKIMKKMLEKAMVFDNMLA